MVGSAWRIDRANSTVLRDAVSRSKPFLSYDVSLPICQCRTAHGAAVPCAFRSLLSELLQYATHSAASLASAVRTLPFAAVYCLRPSDSKLTQISGSAPTC